MKAKKTILGLILCLGMMLTMGSLQKHTQTNIGWGISALCNADDNTTSINVTVGAVGGATVSTMLIVSAAQTGAKIGCVGGVLGILGGAAVGAL